MVRPPGISDRLGLRQEREARGAQLSAGQVKGADSPKEKEREEQE